MCPLQVIYEVPPGQAPSIVRFVSASVPSLLALATDGQQPRLQVLAALLAGCLGGLRVELTTAPVLASALEGLISDALGSPLCQQLRRVRTSFVCVLIHLPALLLPKPCMCARKCAGSLVCSRPSIALSVHLR
jgi:hypothetical protein